MPPKKCVICDKNIFKKASFLRCITATSKLYEQLRRMYPHVQAGDLICLTCRLHETRQQNDIDDETGASKEKEECHFEVKVEPPFEEQMFLKEVDAHNHQQTLSTNRAKENENDEIIQIKVDPGSFLSCNEESESIFEESSGNEDQQSQSSVPFQAPPSRPARKHRQVTRERVYEARQADKLCMICSSQRMQSAPEIYREFDKLLAVLCKHLKVTMEPWNLNVESFPFCVRCTQTAKKLMDLELELEILQIRIKDLTQSIQARIASSSDNNNVTTKVGSYERKAIEFRQKALQNVVCRGTENVILMLPKVRLEEFEDQRMDLTTRTGQTKGLVTSTRSGRRATVLKNYHHHSNNDQTQETEDLLLPDQDNFSITDLHLHNGNESDELVSNDGSDINNMSEEDKDPDWLEEKTQKKKHKSQKQQAEKPQPPPFFDVTDCGNLKHGDFEFIKRGDKFECATCGNGVLLGRSSTRNHLENVHFPKKSYLCNICGKSYSCKYYLKKHVQVSHGNGNIECPICGKPLKNKRIVEVHLWAHKSREEKEAELAAGKKPLGVFKKAPKDKQCPHCGKLFDSASLKSHQRTLELIDIPRTFNCLFCPKSFKTEKALKKHQVRHSEIEMKFQCQVCIKRFPTEWELILHKRSHTGEKPYQCSECGKRFSFRFILKSHMVVHTNERPFQCKFCSITYRYRGSLKRHYETCQAKY